jgi:hypothetical protein
LGEKVKELTTAGKIILSFTKQGMWFLFYISDSTLTPGMMKSLLVAAFTICSCVLVYAQQAESSKETRPIQTSQEVTTPPVIPEPLFVISVGGIEKEISKEELEKITINQIASVEMLVDNELLKEYGEKGKNGVMIINLREDL